ncbi:hypothetical protein OG533_37725 [Streptomyces sp. NBC_01186]|nr:hypothetical protein OG533_37725 [Streptomyces sp. NBC_01186]
MNFSEAEISYPRSQPLGRLATVFSWSIDPSTEGLRRRVVRTSGS